MAVNLLLVTHGRIGAEILDSARATFGGELPMLCNSVPISHDCEPDTVIAEIQRLVDALADNTELLILTDLYGATPCNITHHYAHHAKINIIAGVNLPMLIRVLNYSNSSSDELINKAISGGREGILVV